MFKKNILILISSIALVISISGCSLFSSDSSSEGTEEAVVADEAGGEEDSFGDDDSSFDAEAPNDVVSEEFSDDVGDSDIATGDEEVVDDYPDDDYGGDAAGTTVVDSGSSDLPDDTLVGNEEETLFIGSEDDGDTEVADNSFQEIETQTVDDDQAPVADNASDGEFVAAEEVIPQEDSYEPVATRSWTPVKEMKKTPYTRSGSLINRLYIVREGDTMSSVASKIYGDSGRSGDLVRWNSHFTGRNINVGDKIYYASAINPNDNNQIRLYYEESGQSPSYYTTQKGESIRKVSKNLLGHSNSWMEIWATNNLTDDQKWTLPQGTQLRYWTGTGAQNTMAQNTPPPTPEPAPEPVADEQQAQVIADNEMETQDPAPMDEPDSQVAAIPGEDEAMDIAEEPIEEPPAMDNNGATVANMDEPPPPPPSEAVAPPPPPPPQPVAPPAPPVGSDGGIASMLNGQGDNSMVMGILGGLLILAAFILLIFIRRGRKKVKYS